MSSRAKQSIEEMARMRWSQWNSAQIDRDAVERVVAEIHGVADHADGAQEFVAKEANPDFDHCRCAESERSVTSAKLNVCKRDSK